MTCGTARSKGELLAQQRLVEPHGAAVRQGLQDLCAVVVDEKPLPPEMIDELTTFAKVLRAFAS
ncbi:hypothetical protein [Streptomyces sp. CL12-4]|uniref:hypothetical protein n=1 Tax=Streptomyces sp. CL12-4 TaxID=2810306 RepID=UPI001EFBA7F9|nr:hypothetical protein [Streptomyces sp. CL12-4]MCG8965462.1 hypothetical protein [Streptomyces sp. CL12-4]